VNVVRAFRSFAKLLEGVGGGIEDIGSNGEDGKLSIVILAAEYFERAMEFLLSQNHLNLCFECRIGIDSNNLKQLFRRGFELKNVLLLERRIENSLLSSALG
jgi:hypothetical protein